MSAFLHDVGVNLPAIASKAGLARVPSEEMAFYPYSDAVALLQHGAVRSSIEYIGYVYAREAGLRALGAFGQFVVSAPTLYRAILRANRMVKWVSPSLNLSLEREGSLVSWRAQHPKTSSGFAYQGYLHTISLFVEVVRLAAPLRWRPMEIRVGNQALCNPVLEQVIGAPVRFVDNEWAVIFSRSLLPLPLEQPFRPEQEHTYAALEASALDSDLANSLNAIVRSLLICGEANEERVAHILDMPKRTFQRHIQAAVGMPFRDFIAEIRLQEARRLLSDPDCRVREIATRLGYTGQANFSRAFSRWTGMSPSEYRADLQREP